MLPPFSFSPSSCLSCYTYCSPHLAHTSTVIWICTLLEHLNHLDHARQPIGPASRILLLFLYILLSFTPLFFKWMSKCHHTMSTMRGGWVAPTLFPCKTKWQKKREEKMKKKRIRVRDQWSLCVPEAGGQRYTRSIKTKSHLITRRMSVHLSRLFYYCVYLFTLFLTTSTSSSALSFLFLCLCVSVHG